MVDIIQILSGLLAPVSHTEIIRIVIPKFADIGQVGDIGIKPFTSDAAAKGTEKGIVLCKLCLYAGISNVVKITCLDIMKGIGIYGFVVDGPGGAEMIFPFHVAGGVSDIIVGEKSGAEFCIRAASELVAAAFQGIEGIEVSDGAYIEWAGGFKAGCEEGDHIHQAMVRFHFYEAVDIGVGPGFGGF